MHMHTIIKTIYLKINKLLKTYMGAKKSNMPKTFPI